MVVLVLTHIRRTSSGKRFFGKYHGLEKFFDNIFLQKKVKKSGVSGFQALYQGNIIRYVSPAKQDIKYTKKCQMYKNISYFSTF